MKTKENYGFHSVSLAIQTLKRGKKDDRWFDAARFLIDRAAPHVKLMLDAQKAITEWEFGQNKPEGLFQVIMNKIERYRWGLFAIGLLVTVQFLFFSTYTEVIDFIGVCK